jgi:integration host factor subunit alpha
MAARTRTAPSGLERSELHPGREKACRCARTFFGRSTGEVATGGLAMAGKTVTRADLCEVVYQKLRLSRSESAALVGLVLKEITGSLERGETVKLSSFGSFAVRKKGQRIGRNPKTGKEVPISPRRVVVFKPSTILKQRINSQSEGRL